MIRFRIGSWFDLSKLLHKKKGFQSVASNVKYEDTHGLIPNIELKSLDVDKQSENERKVHIVPSPSVASTSSGNGTAVTEDSDVVPPICVENRVYSSPSEEIVGFGGGDHFAQFFNSNSRKLSDDEASVILVNECLGGLADAREGFINEDRPNSSHPSWAGDERYEVRNSICRQPRQLFLVIVMSLVAFVLLGATVLTILTLRAHVADLHSKQGVRDHHAETLSGDMKILERTGGNLQDLHAYDTAEKQPHLSKSSAEEILHDLGNFDELLTSDDRNRQLLVEEASNEDSISKWMDKLSQLPKLQKIPPTLYPNKSAEIATAIAELEREFFTKDYVHIHSSPVDSNLPYDNHTDHIISLGFMKEDFYRGLVNKLELTVLEANEGIILFDKKTLSVNHCQPFPKLRCNGTQGYRSLDGSCNNLLHPNWGKAIEPYRRILFPAYNDGVTLPRSETWDGHPLPNAREVSMNVHIDEFVVDNEATLLLRNWAQFVKHDIIHTAVPSESSTGQICCDAPFGLAFNGSECFSIRIPQGDHFYNEKGVSCLPVARSAPHFMNCSLGPREQFNQMTSYLDASNIYGTSLAQSKLLRYDFGRLKTFHTDDGKTFLPVRTDPNDTCNLLRKDEFDQRHYCFLAGDPDVNKEATLTALHTIWVRHHNHVAKILSKYNLHWDDERIFQETRKIVTAQVQHITYNEFLPEILPESLLEKASLKLKHHGFFQEYDPTIDPSVSNAFTTVFQFTQSMVQGLVKTICSEGKNENYEQIHKLINNPFILWTEGKLGSLIRGIISQKAQQVDHYISGQLTHLYNQNQTMSYGLDLAAEIIQRGRDHGLHPYVQWRQACQLPNVTSFKDLEEVWHTDAMAKIRSTYKSVLDVDLFTGMLAEKHLPGGRVGPTISCFVADQFSRLRRGDRFWYEGDIYMQRFSSQQLKELRGTTLARIICDSGEGVKSIALRPMLVPSKSNPLVECSDVPKVSFSLWKEKNLNSSYSEQPKEKSKRIDDFMHDLSQEEWIDSYEEYSEHRSQSNHTHHSPSEARIIDLSPKRNVTDNINNGTLSTEDKQGIIEG